jgi:hypothetical protein
LITPSLTGTSSRPTPSAVVLAMTAVVNITLSWSDRLFQAFNIVFYFIFKFIPVFSIMGFFQIFVILFDYLIS